MSEATIELPRKRLQKKSQSAVIPINQSQQKKPMVRPLKPWEKDQVRAKVVDSLTTVGDTVLKTATATGLAVVGTQVHQPPGVEIVQAKEQSPSLIEHIKETYTDLLTKNSKDQEAARTLVNKQREIVMGIVTNPYTASESKHLQVVMKDENKNKIIAEAIKNNLPVPPVLAFALIENSGTETAVSSAGAVGIFQLGEAAAKEMGLKPDERFIASKNIEAGVKYIALQRDRFGGDLGLAAIAYYIGPDETLTILNNHARHTRGYPIISPGGSFDDPLSREILGNYIRTNHVSAFSLLESEPTRMYFGEDEKGEKLLEEVKKYVPRIVAGAEYLVENGIEAEKIFVTFPNIPHASKPPTDNGAVV